MKKAIIVVDDEMIVLVPLKYELQKIVDETFEIMTCQSADETIELIDSLIIEGYEIPLVVTDYIMPGIYGDELLIDIHKKYPEIIGIMLTGFADLKGVVNAINNAHLFHFIQKPWVSKQLQLTVESALTNYYKEKALKTQRIELIKANELLSKLDKSKNDFLFLLSHELNTPLTSIILANNLLMQSNNDNDEYCSIIKQSSDRLKRIIELSLVIARIKTDSYNLALTTTGIKPILDSVLTYCEHKLTEKDLSLIVNIQENKIQYYVDLSLMHIALSAIIDNSIKYSCTGGIINIDYIDNGDFQKLIIKDNGTGFSDEFLQNPFTIFVSDDIYKHTQGIHLSLTAAKLILDLHGFAIELSNNPEGGACVTIKLLNN